MVEENFITLKNIEIYVFIGLLAVVISVAVPANCLVAISIYAFKKLRTVHNILVLNLCLSNLITALIATSFTLAGLVLQLTERTEIFVCYVRHLSIFTSLFANFCILTVLSIEKHDCIVRPFTKRLNTRRLKVVIILIWTATLLAGVGISVEYWLLDDKKCFNLTGGGRTTFYYVLTMSPFMMMFVASIVCYSKILYTLKRHTKQVQGTLAQRRRLESQPAKMVAIFIVTFLLLWLPTGIVRILRTLDHGNDAIQHAYVLTGILMLYTTICHPITCIILSSLIRRSIKRMLFGKKMYRFAASTDAQNNTCCHSTPSTLERGKERYV